MVEHLHTATRDSMDQRRNPNPSTSRGCVVASSDPSGHGYRLISLNSTVDVLPMVMPDFYGSAGATRSTSRGGGGGYVGNTFDQWVAITATTVECSVATAYQLCCPSCLNKDCLSQL